MQMPSWHLAKPAKTRGSSILKTLGLLGNWVWGKSEWFIWRQRTNQTKTWTSYETNIHELFSLIIFHIFQVIIQMNLNCWCFLVHTISSAGSSGKNTVHIDTWSNLTKECIYIISYIYINKSKRCTCLVAWKQNNSTGIPSYCSYRPLFPKSPDCEGSFLSPNHVSMLNCGRIVVPLVYHYTPWPFHRGKFIEHSFTTNPKPLVQTPWPRAPRFP